MRTTGRLPSIPNLIFAVVYLEARAGLIFARWPGSVFLATTEAICGGRPVEAQYDALRQNLLLVAIIHGRSGEPAEEPRFASQSPPSYGEHGNSAIGIPKFTNHGRKWPQVKTNDTDHGM